MLRFLKLLRTEKPARRRPSLCGSSLSALRGKRGRLLDRLKKGEDFGVIAKSKSTDPNAEDYGCLGRVDTATLRPELREASRGRAPGQVTSIIKVPGGYAILKVLPESEGSVGQGMSANRDLPLSGKGSIEHPADVAGQMIADLAFQKYPKPPGWEQDLREICEVRKQSLSTLESRLKNRLYPAEKPLDAIQAHYALARGGKMHLCSGEIFDSPDSV